MRGHERWIVDAFAEWLSNAGWAVRREVDFVDLLAERDGERMYVEAKARTAAIGTDVDTMYGQILRRMPIADDAAARFAVVVPAEARSAAVPARLRQMLRIDVYVVDERGTVARCD